MTTQPVQRKRVCFFIPVEQFVEGKGYVPSVVTEDEPGHAPCIGNGPYSQPWFWGMTYEKAKEIAAQENERLGLTAEDVEDIICSSIRAGNLVSARVEARQKRMLDLFGTPAQKGDAAADALLNGLSGRVG